MTIEVKVYQATLIIGASSRAKILEISKLRAGTLIVDDSYPLTFDPYQAINRMTKEKDIITTIAGGIQGPSIVKKTTHSVYSMGI